MVIDSNGNIGINTTTPEYKLEVYGTMALSNNNAIKWRQLTGGGDAYIKQNASNSFYFEGGATIGGAASYRFFDNNSSNEILTMTGGASSKMGIMTSSPTATLSVSGTAYITGNTIITGNVGIGTTTPNYLLSVAGTTTASCFTTDGVNCMSATAKTYVTVCSSGCDYTTDGTADDVQINQAISSLTAGGTVLIRKGTYQITAALGTSTVNNVRIMGEGYGTVLNNTTAASGATDTLDLGSDNTVENIYFLGNITDYSTNYSGTNVNLFGSGNTVKGVWTYGGDAGVKVSAGSNTGNRIIGNSFSTYKERAVLLSNGADYNTVSDNFINGSTTDTNSGKRGIYLLDADHNTVSGNVIKNVYHRGIFVNRGSKYNVIDGNTIDNVVGFIGISIENDTPASSEGPSSYNTISNNNIYNTASKAVDVESNATSGIAYGNTVTGNTMLANAYGVYVGQNDSETTVSGNTIDGPTLAGIYTNGQNTNITGNTIRNTGNQGVYLDVASTNATVNGNTIDTVASGYDAVRVGSKNHNITGNLISNAGRYGIFTTNVSGNVSISGNQISSSTNRGIEIEAANNMVTGNTVINSGLGGATEAIRSIQANNTITGNRAFDTRSAGSKTQTYGYAESGSGNYAMISGNNFMGNASGTVNALGANSMTIYEDISNVRLGVNTTTPGFTLTVAGNVQFTGTLSVATTTVTGTLTVSTAVGIGTTTPSSTLEVYGSVGYSNLVTNASTLTLDATNYFVKCNATSGQVTTTLPTAVGIKGRTYIIKKTDTSANYCVINTTAGQTIDADTSLTLIAPWSSVTLISDNANWLIQ